MDNNRHRGAQLAILRAWAARSRDWRFNVERAPAPIVVENFTDDEIDRALRELTACGCTATIPLHFRKASEDPLDGLTITETGYEYLRAGVHRER
jgi:hypothetical protein